MYNIDGSFFIIETCLKVALTNSMIYLFQNVLLKICFENIAPFFVITGSYPELVFVYH
jgi:hypothetical protein